MINMTVLYVMGLFAPENNLYDCVIRILVNEIFSENTFAICGKTVQSAERNIIMPLLGMTDVKAYYDLKYTRSVKLLTITRETNGERRVNYYYVFGGKDESSAALIQGMTLSGVLLDEVALMPRSFVEQALARCSVAGSKFGLTAILTVQCTGFMKNGFARQKSIESIICILS